MYIKSFTEKDFNVLKIYAPSRDLMTLKSECSFFQNHRKGKQDVFNELSTNVLRLH